MIAGVPKERFAGERRVALIPTDISRLTKQGIEVLLERGAGSSAGYSDEEYANKGATLVETRQELFARSDAIVQVRAFLANPQNGSEDLQLMREGQGLFAMLDPLSDPGRCQELASTGITSFAMELIPRIARAQSMDVLSSMANIAGYRAVLLAASSLPKLFPMMMTAAGTISPAKVFVIGAGVAGLQAIATARRLGAVVDAYDVRPEVKEQVQSVGGQFVVLDLETESAGDKGGYAKAQSEEFYQRQQEMMATYVRAADVVITTAAIPGRQAPRLVTKAMMQGMKPGSVLVDLAAESGGNCELTRAGETVEHDGVAIIGPTNVPSSLPYHASQMYSRNMATFLAHITNEEGELNVDLNDEITSGTLLTQNGEVLHPRCRVPAVEDPHREAKL